LYLTITAVTAATVQDAEANKKAAPAAAPTAAGLSPADCSWSEWKADPLKTDKGFNWKISERSLECAQQEGSNEVKKWRAEPAAEAIDDIVGPATHPTATTTQKPAAAEAIDDSRLPADCSWSEWKDDPSKTDEGLKWQVSARRESCALEDTTGSINNQKWRTAPVVGPATHPTATTTQKPAATATPPPAPKDFCSTFVTCPDDKPQVEDADSKECTGRKCTPEECCTTKTTKQPAKTTKQPALAKNGASCNEDKECASSLCGITNGTCMQGEADNRAGSEGCLYEFSTWGKCEKKGKNCTRERAILKWSADWSLYKSGKNCQSPPKGKFTAPHPTLGTKPCEICTETTKAPEEDEEEAGGDKAKSTTRKPAAPKVTYTEEYCQKKKGFCCRQHFATFTTACKAVCEAHAAWCTKFKKYCEEPDYTIFRNECKAVCVERRAIDERNDHTTTEHKV